VIDDYYRVQDVDALSVCGHALDALHVKVAHAQPKRHVIEHVSASILQNHLD